jgi:hypothetical protein
MIYLYICQTQNMYISHKYSKWMGIKVAHLVPSLSTQHDLYVDSHNWWEGEMHTEGDSCHTDKWGKICVNWLNYNVKVQIYCIFLFDILAFFYCHANWAVRLEYKVHQTSIKIWCHSPLTWRFRVRNVSGMNKERLEKRKMRRTLKKLEFSINILKWHTNVKRNNWTTSTISTSQSVHAVEMSC